MRVFARASPFTGTTSDHWRWDALLCDVDMATRHYAHAPATLWAPCVRLGTDRGGERGHEPRVFAGLAEAHDRHPAPAAFRAAETGPARPGQRAAGGPRPHR